jgi:hypothetical protein
MYLIFVKKTAYILLFSFKRVRITVYSVQLAVILENFQLALSRSWRRGVGKLLPTTLVRSRILTGPAILLTQEYL